MASSSGSIVISANLSDTLAPGATRLSQYTVPVVQAITTAFANGTAANQVNKLYMAQISLAAAAQSIDLTSVTCTDGTTGLSFVRALIVFNPDTNSAHTVNFGDDSVGTNIFLGALTGTHPQYVVQPSTAYIDQHPLGTNGYACTSNKNLRLDPGANTIIVLVIAAGS